jgi:hypothetical protein
LQLGDEIIYGYPVDDMLNNTKKIIDRLKQVINFFYAHYLSIKLSKNSLTTVPFPIISQPFSTTLYIYIYIYIYIVLYPINKRDFIG